MSNRSQKLRKHHPSLHVSGRLLDKLEQEAGDATQRAEAAAAAERREDRVAELDAKVFQGMARGREANIEVGRALNELKKILGHGKWQRHLAETFAPCGVTLRSAERYMKMASEADAVSKNDNLSTFKPATDRGAQEIRNATERAQAEVGAPSGQKLKKEPRRVDGIYKLPLRMTGDEKDAMDALRKLPDWPRAEKRIIALLKRLWVKYGIVNKDARRRS